MLSFVNGSGQTQEADNWTTELDIYLLFWSFGEVVNSFRKTDGDYISAEEEEEEFIFHKQRR